MKIQIIQLEPDDDHASARDKLAQVRAPSALLVWPRRGRPLARQLDLELVARQAHRRGIGLGLVVFDPEIRAVAARIGVPVYDSLEASPTPLQPGQALNPKLPDRPDRPSIAELREARSAVQRDPVELPPRARQVGFGLAVASIVILGGILLPRASITVRPDQELFERTVGIWIDPDLDNGPSAGRIPGHRMAVLVSGELRRETSGQTRLPSGSATGEVRFLNLTDELIELPVGTGVRAKAARFVTTEPAVLEAGPGATVSVPIHAALPGRSGNVASGEIQAVEGELGFMLRVTNLEPTSGGQDVVVGAAATQDFALLRKDLESALLEQAESEIRAELSRGSELLPDSLRVSRVETEHYDRLPGVAAETLGLELTLEVEGLSFLRAEAAAAINTQLRDLVPAGWVLVPDTLDFQAMTPELRQTDGAAHYAEFRSSAETARQVPFARIRSLARGAASLRVAEQLRTEFDLAQAPLVQNHPRWLPWLPLLEMQIEVRWPWDGG